MKEIVTAIDVAARKERVWTVLATFAAYPDWNPLLRTIAGALQPGAPLAITFAVGRRTFHGDATVLRVVPGRELRWAGPISRLKGFVFRAEHYFIIEEQGPERVRLVHGERFDGAAVPFLGRWLDATLAPTFEAMNVALQRRAEAATSCAAVR